MNWNDVTDRDLWPLVKNPRSPFFMLKESAMRNVLVACNAELVDTSLIDIRYQLPVGDDRHVEGIILMRQHQPQTHIYIPLTGSLVVFESRPLRNPGDQQFQLERWAPITIEVLRRHFIYNVSIHAGEVCGQLGFITKCFERFGRSKKSIDFSVRRQALNRAHLLDLAGRWGLSGFASLHSKVIAIEMDKLIGLMNDQAMWGDAVGWERKGQECRTCKNRLMCRNCGREQSRREPVLHPKKPLRRCSEDSVIRHSHIMYRHSLLVRGMYDHALAGHFYEHFRGSRKRSIKITNPQIAWYLGLGDEDDVPSKIGINLERGNEKGFWRRIPTSTSNNQETTHRSSTFDLDPGKLLSYYKSELNTFGRT